MSQTSTENRTSRVSRIKSAFGRSLSRILFRRDRVWMMIVSAVTIVVAVGWWANRSVETSVKSNIASQLQALLKADVAALRIWLDSETHAARVFAQRDSVRTPIVDLARIAADPSSNSVTADLLSSPSLQQLRTVMQDFGRDHEGQGFTVVDRDLRIIAGEQDGGIGNQQLARGFDALLRPVLDGGTAVLPPFKSLLVHTDNDGNQRAGMPVMYIMSAVKNDREEVIAALGVRLRPEKTFSQILSVARAGESGETYAFNRDGVMITNSRFDNELKRIGLLLDTKDSHSLLNIEIRDPGVDMTTGARPLSQRSDQPLTRMAQHAIEHGDGVDVEGYPDYRGVPVIGAWTWLEEYRMGVATEVDVEEAFQPLYAQRRAFWLLTGLLVVGAGVNGWLAVYASVMEYRAREAAIEGKRLGQYTLDEELGAGGMGTVYRAHHDLLRRPTAVKLLNIDKTNDETIARFEQEVQLTSQLTHPNTIAVYDYGRTEAGVFYYAMEYLEGLELEGLVEEHGPQPASRVIFILKQVCRSLCEAHGRGLIHRDIKPSNIMLTQRGGMGDFVKLLDFGLVKSQSDSLNVTGADALLGTPHYLPPEIMNSETMDARSDLYSLGGVAYFLLSGRTVFEGKTAAEVCMKHAGEQPVPPSERSGRSVDADLENIVMACLAKKQSDRPDSAATLWEQLDACSAAGFWTQRDADEWWSESHRTPATDSAELEKTNIGSQLTKTIVQTTKGEDEIPS